MICPHDYIYRPSVFGSVNLYDWIQYANKKRKSSRRHKEDSTKADDITEDDIVRLGNLST